MNQIKIHYIYDPLCGWCYGAAPLIKAAREVVHVEAHAGGMMTGAQRRAITPGLREFVVGHDRRIAQASGQLFGDAYIHGLLHDNTAVLDSGPPITAVLAAERVAQRGLDMLARLQTGHYVEGRRLTDAQTLHSLAVDIGVDGKAFDVALEKLSGTATTVHIDHTRTFMAQLGVQGFPGALLESEGNFASLDITAYIGRTDDWLAHLSQELGSATQAASPGFTCALQGDKP